MTAAPRHPRLRRPSAFTLVEALVSVGLLVAVMAAVAQVFSLSSKASARTLAQAETLEAANAFEQAVRRQISRLRPNGLLIIDSPPAVVQGDIVNGERLPLRNDRLVLLASGAPTQFESVTDRGLPSPTNPNNNASSGTGRAFTSGDALVYFGPALPDGRALVDVPGRQWIVSKRVVLLGVPANAFTSFTTETPLATYPLDMIPTAPAQGLYNCGIDAVLESPAELLDGIGRIRERLLATVNGTTIHGLLDASACPTDVNTVVPTGPTNNLDYYARTGFALQARIADVRIEWSDGSFIDPRDLQDSEPIPNLTSDGLPDNAGTQWYGAPRDTGESRLYTAGVRRGWSAPDIAPVPSGDVCEKWRWLQFYDAGAVLPESAVTAFARAANAGRIESDGGIPNQNSYRAIWTQETWAFRPKALRFTFRAYDKLDRLTNVEPVDTTVPADGTNDANVRRFGLEYSFVVKLPS